MELGQGLGLKYAYRSPLTFAPFFLIIFQFSLTFPGIPDIERLSPKHSVAEDLATVHQRY